MQNAGLFIVLQEQNSSDTLIKVYNGTTVYDLLVHQKSSLNDSYIVPSQDTLPFAWTNPCADTRVIVELTTDKLISSEIECSLDKLNEPVKKIVKFRSRDNGFLHPNEKTICFVVLLVGRAKVLKVFENDIVKEESPKKRSNSLIRCSIPGLGFSLISTANAQKHEMAYISARPLIVAIVSDNETTEAQIRIQSLIIDNNARDNALYPVIMLPYKMKQLKENNLPYIDLAFKLRKSQKDTDVTTYLPSDYTLTFLDFVYQRSCILYL